MKEAELRDRVLTVLPTLNHPTFRVLHGYFGDRLKRGLLDRTLRHMSQEDLIVKVKVVGDERTTQHYQLTQDGFTQRARLLLTKRPTATQRR